MYTMSPTNSNQFIIGCEPRKPWTSLMTAQEDTAPMITTRQYKKCLMHHIHQRYSRLKNENVFIQKN